MGTKTQKTAQASIWLHISNEERWKEHVPANLEASCIKLYGPVSWAEADEILQGMKVRFDQLGIEHFELTDCDD